MSGSNTIVPKRLILIVVESCAGAGWVYRRWPLSDGKKPDDVWSSSKMLPNSTTLGLVGSDPSQPQELWVWVSDYQDPNIRNIGPPATK